MEKDLNIKVGKQIGKGSFGDIYRAIDLKTGCFYALKKIEKKNLDEINNEKIGTLPL